MLARPLNKHIKVRGANEKRRWTLNYPSTAEPVNNPFDSHLPGISITDLLWFVATNTAFLSEFTHVLDRTEQTPVNLGALTAPFADPTFWKQAMQNGGDDDLG